MEVVKETSPTKSLSFGHTQVGLTAVKLCESFPVNRGIIIRCPGSSDPTPNTACVWLGNSPNVTATTGMPIPPGSHLILPVSDPSQLYVISTVANQDVAWMGV